LYLLSYSTLSELFENYIEILSNGPLSPRQ
jgi:hypothetical protein